MPDQKSPKRRIRKSSGTVRERADAAKAERSSSKPRRLRRSIGAAGRPLQAVRTAGRREYYLPLPDNRWGRFLNKRRRAIPRYFRESWAELRQVVWPSRKETFKLTLAVFTFAIVFALLVSITDYGLDKIFRKVLLK